MTVTRVPATIAVALVGVGFSTCAAGRQHRWVPAVLQQLGACARSVWPGDGRVRVWQSDVLNAGARALPTS